MCFLGWTSSVLKFVSQKNHSNTWKRAPRCEKIPKTKRFGCLWLSTCWGQLYLPSHYKQKKSIWWHPCSFESCQVFFKKISHISCHGVLFSRYPHVVLTAISQRWPRGKGHGKGRGNGDVNLGAEPGWWKRMLGSMAYGNLISPTYKVGKNWGYITNG